MDEDRLEHVCAEATALRIIVAALTDLYPDPAILRQTIQAHANACAAELPTDTEEQKEYIALVRRKLNTFSELI